MRKNVSLMVRLDQESKDLLAAAAELRRVSVSDYVRSVMVGQAARELAAANSQTIALSEIEQLVDHSILATKMSTGGLINPRCKARANT